MLKNNVEDIIFWSDLEDTSGDFTAEDPLALDYLAQQVGYWLFPGFTTRTTRAQYYPVVLYGLHLAQEALEKFGIPDSDEARQALFERWERFWALSVLEYNEGPLERGHFDSMRGVLGANAAWNSSRGRNTLSLDYQLISRQTELGGLGAYLSSLRYTDLVTDGTLRPTPAAYEILQAFWDEPVPMSKIGSFHRYALHSLVSDKMLIGRKESNVRLRHLGRLSRLSVLKEKYRKKQRQRVWKALFENVRDKTTLPLATAIIMASRDGVFETLEILEGVQKGQWINASDELLEVLGLALAYGHTHMQILGLFNQAYSVLKDKGFKAPLASLAAETIGSAEMKALKKSSQNLLKLNTARFKNLPMHGRSYLSLINVVAQGDHVESFRSILNYHRAVQRDRRRGEGWMFAEGRHVVLHLGSYNPSSSPGFPAFKLDAVRNILRDLRRVG